MCGFVGYLVSRAARPPGRGFLEAASTSMLHRGPDARGIETGEGWGLGFRRLAILDLSPAAHQPMSDSSGRCWLAFNGEIYNYRELRRELEESGHTFRSTGDAEVLLTLLCADGVGALDRINGMFAFAFLDLRRRTLLLARDRLGVKPLLYYQDADRLVFGSELKAVMMAPGVPRRRDDLALNQYLCFNYVPAPRTIYEGVSKLMPGHYLEVKLGRPGAARPRRYWELRFEPDHDRAPGDWAEEVEALLLDSVDRRLASDVPVGTFLSGGLDSSLVTAMASRGGRRPDLLALTVGFRESAWDESRVARRLAEHCGVRHRVEVLEPDAWAVLPELVRHYEEPYADSSAVPTWYLCKAARAHATVFLSGDGGDEAFAGYGRYRVVRATRWLERVPMALRRAVSRSGAAITPVHSLTHHRALRLGLADAARYYAQAVLPGDPVNLLPLVPEARRSHDEITAFFDVASAGAAGLPPVSAMQSLDYRIYLTNDILVKVDRASMAHSIEVRGPFLDYRLAELAARVPADVHLNGGAGKRVLRDIAPRYVPAAVLAHPKQGFGVPLPVWFRGATLDRIEERLLDGALKRSGVCDTGGMGKLIDWQRRGGGRDFSHVLWRLAFLEEWFGQFEGASSRVPAA